MVYLSLPHYLSLPRGSVLLRVQLYKTVRTYYDTKDAFRGTPLTGTGFGVSVCDPLAETKDLP